MGLPVAQRILQALGAHRTSRAYVLCLRFTGFLLFFPLEVIGGEEHLRVFPAAGSAVLPAHLPLARYHCRFAHLLFPRSVLRSKTPKRFTRFPTCVISPISPVLIFVQNGNSGGSILQNPLG